MLEELSDFELVDSFVQQKDEKILSVLFVRHVDIAYRTALRITKNSADAEDIVQISFVELMRTIQSFRKEGSFLSWFLKIVSHRSLDYLRADKKRMAREFRSLQQDDYEDKTLETIEEQKKMVEAHLLKLPFIYREPIYLKMVEGLDTSEISKILSKPEKTIRTQISRGIERLKISLEETDVRLSTSAIIVFLSQIPLHPAPISLVDSLLIKNLKTQIFMSKGGSFFSSLFFKISVAIMASLVLGVMIYSAKGEVKQKTKEEFEFTKPKIVQQNKKKFYTEFESEDILKLFQVVYGATKITKDIGIDKSSALEVPTFSCLSIDISQYKLPIQVSFLYDFYSPSQNNKNVVTSVEFYEQKDFQKTLYLITNLHQIQSVDIDYKKKNKMSNIRSKWYKRKIFFYEDRIETWLNDGEELAAVLFTEPSKNIHLWFMGQMFIDNFKIEEIDGTSNLDTSRKIQALRSIYEEVQNEQLLVNQIYNLSKRKNARNYFPDTSQITVINYQSMIDLQNSLK